MVVRNLGTLALVALLLPACSSAPAKPQSQFVPEAPGTDPAAAPQTTESQELKTRLEQMASRMEALETKLTSLNEKVDATKTTVENVMGVERAKPVAAVPHPSEHLGTQPETAPASNDPEGGFINDSAVAAYRQAMILLHGQKLPEAILAFSAFLERYADHALAGSAQFHVGECYLLQKEYRLALREFDRVLTSYDRSSHVAETLRQIAVAQEALGKPKDAAQSRQRLSSLFPQSPAAAPNAGRLETNALAAEPTRTKAKHPELVDEPPLAPETASIPAQKKGDDKVDVSVLKEDAQGKTAGSPIDPPPTAPLTSGGGDVPAAPADGNSTLDPPPGAPTQRP